MRWKERAASPYQLSCTTQVVYVGITKVGVRCRQGEFSTFVHYGWSTGSCLCAVCVVLCSLSVVVLAAIVQYLLCYMMVRFTTVARTDNHMQTVRVQLKKNGGLGPRSHSHLNAF